MGCFRTAAGSVAYHAAVDVSDHGRGGTRADASPDAEPAVSSDSDLHATLEQIVASARDLTGAGAGYLEVLAEDGAPVAHIAQGFSDDEIRALGSRRCDAHPGATESPAGVLGLPLSDGETVCGHLYLDRKVGDAEFTRGDRAGVGALARVAGLVIRNARRYCARERRRAWVEASVEIAESLHETTRVEDTLALIAEGAHRASRAELVAVVRETDRGSYQVSATAGSPTEVLPELLDLFADEIATVAASGELVTSPYDGDGTVLFLPLASPVSDHGVLVATLGTRGLTPDDRELVRSFAAHASLVLDRVRAVIDQHERVLLNDRNRIARDLHDVVIQRLFSTGLHLKARRPSVTPEARERIDAVVSDLDHAIRDIRSTIFELERGDAATPREELGALVREYGHVLGYPPELVIDGPLDSLLGRPVADQLLTVAREALSNCARHARASACRIEVLVDSEWLLLAVSDNGRGPGDGVRRSGLRNLRRRAEQLGGAMMIEAIDPRGTCLTWYVPTEP